MTRQEQIFSLRRERKEIQDRIDALVQEDLAERAVAKVDELIEWQYAAKQKRRGRVTALLERQGQVAYVVQIVRRDGSDGGTIDVYASQSPERYSAGS